MNNGINGTVTATITAATQSCGQEVHPDQQGGRRREQQGRQVAAQVAVEGVHPAGGERAELPVRREAGVARAEAQRVLDELRAQLGPDPGAGAHRRGLGGPHEHRPADDHDHEPAEQRCEDRERLPPGEGPGDHLGEQDGLGDDEARGDHACRGRERHEGADGADPAQQAGVERPHVVLALTGSRPGRPAAGGMSDRVIRPRKTQ